MSAITQNPHLDVVPATAKTLIVASDPGLLGKAEVDVRVAVHSAGGWHVDNLKLTQAAPVARVAAAGGDAVSLIVATAGAQAGYGFA